MSSKPNFDVNVDGRTDGRTNGRTEFWTPISHPAISRCDKPEDQWSCKRSPEICCIYECYRQELRGGQYRTCIGQSQQTVKYSSRAPGQGACLKGMSRTITMQGFRFAAISDVEKTKLQHKNFQSQWTVKYRSRAPD